MKTTEQLNAEFTAATPEGKRILIAEDVLSQLAAKRFQSTQGNWLTILVGNSPASMQVCDIQTNPNNCSCCLLGAMMLSEVRINNHLAIEELPKDTNVFGGRVMYYDRNPRFDIGPSQGARLAEYFDADQLRLIEIAYEWGNGFYEWDEESVTDTRAVDLGMLHNNTDDRMRAIMENVIANNGVFVP